MDSLISGQPSEGSFCVSPIGDGSPVPRRQEFRIASSPAQGQNGQYTQHAQHVQYPHQPIQNANRSVSDKNSRWNPFPNKPSSSNLHQVSEVDSHRVPHHQPIALPAANAPEPLRLKKRPTAPPKTSDGILETSPRKEDRSRSSPRAAPGEHHFIKVNGSASLGMEKQLSLPPFTPTNLTIITSGGPATSLPTTPTERRAPSPPRIRTQELKIYNEFARPDFKLSPRKQDIDAGVQLEALLALAKGSDTNNPEQQPSPSGVPPRKKVPGQPLLAEEPKDAGGRIKAMETEHDEIKQRIAFLEDLIGDLERLFHHPRSTVVIDSTVKAEVENVVKDLEEQIAIKRKSEHELGMKITRAWRRFDEAENAGDGNTLWVKRVTG